MVTWPHELVYTAAGQPAVYEELSITLFICELISGSYGNSQACTEANHGQTPQGTDG